MSWADRVCREVAELPDRTSPEDWPDAMLVTTDELHAILVTGADELFEAIKHGDEKHQAWLRQMVDEWFGKSSSAWMDPKVWP